MGTETTYLKNLADEATFDKVERSTLVDGGVSASTLEVE